MQPYWSEDHENVRKKKKHQNNPSPHASLVDWGEWGGGHIVLSLWWGGAAALSWGGRLEPGGDGVRVSAPVLVAPGPTGQTHTHGRMNYKDTNPYMSSLLVIFVWGGEAILKVLNLVRNRVLKPLHNMVYNQGCESRRQTISSLSIPRFR